MQNSSITHTTPAGDIVIHTSGNIHIENSELHTAKDLTIECISERCVVDSDKTNELHAGHTIIVRAKNSVYLKGTNMEAKHAVRIFGTYDAWLQKTKENQMPMVAAQFFSLVSIKTESHIGDWVFVEAKIRIVVRSWHGKARVYSAHVSALKVFVLGATYADIARTHVDAGFLWVITNTTCGNNPCVRAWRSNVTAKQVFLDTPNHNGTINVCAATFTTSHPKKGVVANNVPTAPYPMTVSYTNAQCTALGLGNGATFKTQKTSIPPPHKK